MSAKAWAKPGRCRITDSEGPRFNGGSAGVADDEPEVGACIGIAEAAGDAALDAAGAEAAGGGALLFEHAAQMIPSNATAESFTNRFMTPPGAQENLSAAATISPSPGSTSKAAPASGV
jgi:hypothetical protein